MAEITMTMFSGGYREFPGGQRGTEYYGVTDTGDSVYIMYWTLSVISVERLEAKTRGVLVWPKPCDLGRQS